MMIRSLFLAIFLLSAASLQAQEKNQPKETTKSALVTTATIAVNSIQCNSCVRAVQKALRSVKGVESARVDLKKKVATVTYVSATTSIAELETAITAVGYDANDKKADPEAYAKLDECCKVPPEGE